jgi:hypothetical protein
VHETFQTNHSNFHIFNNTFIHGLQVVTQPITEPAAVVLVGIGLAGLAGVGTKRRLKKLRRKQT